MDYFCVDYFLYIIDEEIVWMSVLSIFQLLYEKRDDLKPHKVKFQNEQRYTDNKA